MTGSEMGRGLGERLGCTIFLVLGAAMVTAICLWEFGWWVCRHVRVLWS